MCGIFGRFAWDAPPADEAALGRIVDSLAHRGPDGGAFWSEGPFYLGHRRLAILDLSEAGAQPMMSPDGRFVLTFNGEIYNYLELARELETLGHTFRSRSDTEVLLAGWAQWKHRLLPKLTGMFAFGIVDQERRELVLARDRFGEKPLFVSESRGEVVFASEIRAIAAYRDAADRAVDLVGLTGYLCLNFVPGERTLLEGVRRLAPGTSRTYRFDGSFVDERYWQPAPEQSEIASSSSFSDVVDELRVRLDDAVRVALRSDVPVALFLSGGIDSSLVAESAVRQGHLRDAFCLDVDEKSFSEWNNAKWVADRLGLSLHHVPLRENALDDFFDIVDHADDPLADSSAVAVWTLARSTAERFKVAVSGDGGDELFGGYLTYKATAIHRAATSRLGRGVRKRLADVALRTSPSESKVSMGYKLARFLRAADLPPSEAHFCWNGAWHPKQAARLVRDPSIKTLALDALRRVAASHSLPERPTLRELQCADGSEYLPNDILTKVDRMTMAHSLESRSPLLDERLASLALAATERFEGSPFAAPKRLLRALADRTFGPRVSRAKKQGFSIPIHAWMRGRGRPLIEDLLARSSLQSLPFLDSDEISNVKHRFLEKKEPLGFEIWGLAVLVAWHRTRVASSGLDRVRLSPLHRVTDSLSAR